MARKLRVQYPGAIYHVMNRGDHSETVFREEADRCLFLTTLGESCAKTDWQIHSYCLMSNHFHLVVETPRGNLVEGMKWLMGTYTSRFNHKHKLFGHLFSGRYKALPIDGSTNGYLKSACDYVHLNPARAHLIPTDQPLETFPWSSYPLYLKERGQRPAWLRTDRLLGEWGIPFDTSAGRAEFASRVEARRCADQPDADAGDYPGGWCIGSEQFREELLLQMSTAADHKYGGPEWRESTAKKALRILAEELERRGLEAGELKRLRKGDPQKIQIARRLRQETTMTWDWIAEHLGMGTPGAVANLLRSDKQS